MSSSSSCSLRGLSTGDPVNKNFGYKHSQDINFYAGTEILERFQSSWAELHEGAQENSTKAQVTSSL